MEPITITAENFEKEVLQSKETVLVDFWAGWCGPCRMLSPIIDEVASAHPDVKIGKVNVDEQPTLASRFDIMSIPTLLVFKDGQAVKQSVGLIPKEGVEALVE